MKKLEPLTTTSELPESTVFDGRLDIPAGAELSPALRRLVEEVRMETAAGSLLLDPVRPRAQPAQPVNGTPCRAASLSPSTQSC